MRNPKEIFISQKQQYLQQTDTNDKTAYPITCRVITRYLNPNTYENICYNGK